jgi:hypothetical protein
MRVSSLGLSALGVLLFVVGPLLIGCGDDAEKPTIRRPQDFLPQVLGGMAPAGAPTIAATADELRDAINGDYWIYTDHDFQELVQQFYQGTVGESQASVEVWIMELPSAEEANALHNDDRIRCLIGAEELDDIGAESVLCPGQGAQTIWFHRDRYWCRVLILYQSYDITEDARTVAELFATHIDQKIME